MRVRTGLADGHAGRRAGFTLVEVMVVIGIIAVLASLLLGAVQRARVFGQRTSAGAEISQLETACAKFKVDFGTNPPQEIEFPPTPGTGAQNAAQVKAVALLKTMFRGYDETTDVVSFRGATATSTAPLKLTGVQSLVFFLSGPNGTGFQKNKPLAAAADSNSKLGPFYVFEANRFIDPETKAVGYDFRDPWGTPYAYFSTAKGSTYDAAYQWAIPNRTGAVLGAFRVGGSGAVASPSPWANPSNVQIVSAGPDGVFGQAYVAPSAMSAGGNLWVPKTGEYADNAVLSGISGNGADDISNFNGGAPLGVAGN